MDHEFEEDACDLDPQFEDEDVRKEDVVTREKPTRLNQLFYEDLKRMKVGHTFYMHRRNEPDSPRLIFVALEGNRVRYENPDGSQDTPLLSDLGVIAYENELWNRFNWMEKG